MLIVFVLYFISSIANAFPISLDQASSCVSLPSGIDSFRIEENYWSMIHSFKITGRASDSNEWQPIGHITSKPFSFSSEQTLYSNADEVIASSSLDSLSVLFETLVPVEDCNGNQIAKATQQMVNTGLSSILLYSVQNPDGTLVVSRETASSSGPGLDLMDQASGKRVGTVRKIGGLKSSDAWELSLNAESPLDARVAILMLASGSPSVAWGFGPLPFVLFLVASLVIAGACIFAACRRRDGGGSSYVSIGGQPTVYV